MFAWFEPLREFFESGGPVLFSILIVSIFLWALILDRYWYLIKIYPKTLERVVKQWQVRNDHSSWYAMRIREGLLAEISIELSQFLVTIQTITTILPLLGLLGTVTGMIAIFEVLNIFGTGNTRGMATGISQALLPTTAGLVTALAGLYFSSDLKQRIKMQTEAARDRLQV